MVATGQLVDLAEYASDVDYTEAALATGQLEDTQYGLPWTTRDRPDRELRAAEQAGVAGRR